MSDDGAKVAKAAEELAEMGLSEEEVMRWLTFAFTGSWSLGQRVRLAVVLFRRRLAV